VLQVTPEELPDDFSPPRTPSEDKEEA